MDEVLKNMLAAYIETSSKQIGNLIELNVKLAAQVEKLESDQEILRRRIRNLEIQHS
jgi:cell division protein FtsB